MQVPTCICTSCICIIAPSYVRLEEERSPCGVMDKVLDCGCEVSVFEFQLRY